MPRLIHMESISNSMWNPWNECWLGPQPIHCSMDIMDSIWNDHGMVMEWSIPYGIHHYSTWIPLDSIWNVGISTMDSMDKSIWIPWNKSIWIPWNSPCGFHGMVHIDTTILIVIVSLLYLSRKEFYNIGELNPRPKQGEQCSN